MTDRNRNRLDAAKTTFRKSTLYACPTPFFSAMAFWRLSRRPFGPPSNIEEDLRNRHDVFQVEDPPRQHLDRQRHHHQEQERRDVVPRRAELRVVRLER